MSGTVMLKSTDGVDVAEVMETLDARELFAQISGDSDEVSTNDYLDQLIERYSITFETARDVLYRLLDDHTLGLTRYYKLHLG